MVRSFSVGVGGALLSWILLYLSIVAWLSWTPSGHFVRGPQVIDKDSVAIQKQYRDPFELLDRAKTGYQLGVIPAISIITGVFVGLTGRMRTGRLAVVALAPLQIFLLAAESFAVWAFVRALVYFLLAYFCASRVQSMRVSNPSKVTPTTA